MKIFITLAFAALSVEAAFNTTLDATCTLGCLCCKNACVEQPKSNKCCEAHCKAPPWHCNEKQRHEGHCHGAKGDANGMQAVNATLEAAADTCATQWPRTSADNHCRIAVAVCLAESGGNCKATNVNSGGSRDRGLWQINDYWHKEVSDSCAYECACNGKNAYRISNSGSSWTQWSTYKNGAYKSHLNTAKVACEKRLLASSSTNNDIVLTSSAQRDALVVAAKSIYDYRAHEKYTEKANLRWDGINNKRQPPHAPVHSDCSSAASWVYWTVFGSKTDHLNGESWKDGYTGSMTQHGKVVSLSNAKRGDLVFYGAPWPYKHVAICYNDGCSTVISHGSDPAGKYDVHYRSDLSHVRSYVQEWH